MNKAIFLLFLLLFINGYSQKEINSSKRTGQISLDGYLEEADWVNANWTSGFTQMKPFPGEKASKKTEVAMLFDQEAIYFGVKCYDHPDSVSRVLSLRDDFNPNLDFFGIFLDTYNDKQNGFFFGLSSRGVQVDAKIFSEDFNDLLNLVWRSKTQINDKGWFAEIKIPYSALRFPK
jgi:hypothetical protein